MSYEDLIHDNDLKQLNKEQLIEAINYLEKKTEYLTKMQDTFGDTLISIVFGFVLGILITLVILNIF